MFDHGTAVEALEARVEEPPSSIKIGHSGSVGRFHAKSRG